MQKTLINLFSILFCLSILNAQQNTLKSSENKTVLVTGKVIDKEDKSPLEFATISFFDIQKNKLTDGVITNTKGKFSIEIPIGYYNVKVEFISYKPLEINNKHIKSNLDLGELTLEINLEALDAIEIIAEKTTVEIGLDKRTYNVGKDLTVSGGTVSDVLDNVPSVSVDSEGGIALRGNSNVQILINGKPSGLSGLSSSEALKQLPAEAIEKVEVITSPSARYQAEGTAGIINIILRRSKLQGLNGALTANVGHPDAAGISGNLNYRTGNFNFFNTTSYNYREFLRHSYAYTHYLNSDTYMDDKTNTNNANKGLTTNLGVTWDIDKKTSITNSVLINDRINHNESVNNILQFDSNQNLTGKNYRFQPENNTNKSVQYAFNFSRFFNKKEHNLSIDFQYENNNQDNLADIFENAIYSEIITSLENKESFLAQLDYVLPIGENNNFEFGYRGDFNTQSTDYKLELLISGTNTFEIDPNLTNLFNFTTNINALYTQYGGKIKSFSYLLGMRMEITQIIIDQPTTGDYIKKDLLGLFPTLNLNYELNEKQSITLGYNRRIGRPHGFQLNPFPSRASLTNVFQGNPDLEPNYANKIDLGYLNKLNKLTISSSIYYQYTTNEDNWVSEETGEFATINGLDVPIIKRTPVNIGYEKRYGVEANIMLTITPKWRVNTNFNFFNNAIFGAYKDINLDSENTTWTLNFNNKYKLPYDIDWQTTINYRGPIQEVQQDREGVLSANIALSKDLFKEKASIAFSVNDLFDSQRYRGIIYTPTFVSNREVMFRGGRIINLVFTYRFNQKKKTEKSDRPYSSGDGDM